MINCTIFSLPLLSAQDISFLDQKLIMITDISKLRVCRDGQGRTTQKKELF